MTTDLSNKTFEEWWEKESGWGGEMLAEGQLAEAAWKAGQAEPARRLEEAQRRYAAHDAKVAALAKVEALEELTAGLDRDEFVSVRTIRQKARHEKFNAIDLKAAEYRAKATSVDWPDFGST